MFSTSRHETDSVVGPARQPPQKGRPALRVNRSGLRPRPHKRPLAIEHLALLMYYLPLSCKLAAGFAVRSFPGCQAFPAMATRPPAHDPTTGSPPRIDYPKMFAPARSTFQALLLLRDHLAPRHLCVPRKRGHFTFPLFVAGSRPAAQDLRKSAQACRSASSTWGSAVSAVSSVWASAVSAAVSISTWMAPMGQ